MDRPIKFKAWDTVGKCMLDWNTICQTAFNRDGEYSLLYLIFRSDTLIPLQFTGLKDKYGNEVYEGHILREPPKDDWDKINYSCFEVFFHDGDAHLDNNIGWTMCRMHNHGSVCGGYVPSFKPKQVSKMEIIGHVFLNPELIKR